MDRIRLRENNSLIDLESGEPPSSEDDKDPGSWDKKAKKQHGRLRSGSLGFHDVDNHDKLSTSESGLNASEENLEILVGGEVGKEEASSMEINNVSKEKSQKRGSMKPPKPPRPPRVPSMDAADMKLVREMSELARSRHVRIERMKALQRKRAGKASSTNGSIFALIITVLFFCIIIFQGILGSRV